jgi:hypothetical protein
MEGGMDKAGEPETGDESDHTLQAAHSRRHRRGANHAEVGPWTISVLRLIAWLPEHRAAELAAQSSVEKEWLKLNIRKLKNLGLTESLTVGYRLSPRGAALLSMMQNQNRRMSQ